MILFVFEGEEREPQLYRSLEKLFFPKETNAIVCSFGNNIYELYKQITLLGEGADIVSVLREQLEGSEENPLKDITTSSAFAEIYLFFDYDLYHRLPLDEINRRLGEMLVLFDDETTNGKLYINYPMIESIRYTKELPDADYYLYTIPKNECGGFKRIAHDFSAYGSLDFLTDTRERRIEATKQHWQHMKDMNVCKANYICRGTNAYPKQKSDIAQQNIFEAQFQKYVNTDECTVAILNAFPIFLYDYLK